MSKILCFISDQFADFEITLAFHKIRTVGQKEVVTVGYQKEPVQSESGILYLPHMTVKEAVEMPEVEGLVIPGGPIRLQQTELTELIQRMDGERKLLAAICNGPQYLGRAGILNQRKFTTSCSEERIHALGVADPFVWGNWIDQRVVADGHVITAKGRAFVDFAFAVFAYLRIYQGRDAEAELLYQEIMNRVAES